MRITLTGDLKTRNDSNQNNVPDWRFYNKPYDAHIWLRPYKRLGIILIQEKTKPK